MSNKYTHICKICGKEIKNIGSHLRIHEIDIKSYYNKYLGFIGKCLSCGRETRFISINESYKEFCSIKCSNSYQRTKEKRVKTCIDKYGVENPFQDKNIQKKYKEACITKFGVDNPQKCLEIKEKSKQTCLQRYGFERYSQTEEFKEKVKQTCLERYNEEHFTRTDEFKERFRDTCMLRYNAPHPTQNKNIKERMSSSNKHVFFRKLLFENRLNSLCIPLFNINEYLGTDYKYSWKCTKCSCEFKDSLYNGKIPRCPICFPKLSSNISTMEKELVLFCKQYYPNLIENDRTILNGKELDIYIPEINLAIEFDGLYWHSELNGVDSIYHLEKTKKCQNKNIQLIHIFEDEWIEKKEIVKSILLAKMGKIEDKIYARKCEIKEVNSTDSYNFLFDNHLQGPINGKSIGLYYNGELVSIVTYGKPRYNKNYDFEILRFCNKKNTIIIGGLSKLISKIEGNIITYCDLRFSSGDSYVKSNFKLVNHSSPSYYYLKNTKRFNRLQFQKHKLFELLEVFDPNLTEWENMQLNGFDRIWDCGNLVFEKS